MYLEYTAVDGKYMARILADSVSPNGVRLTTLIVRFPRFILAEVNTHRVFSRNSASSRAIPTEKMIARVVEDPFVPEVFNARVKGMGIGRKLDPQDQEDSKRSWLRAASYACQEAEYLNNIGIDKSRANRLLEPFLWHTAIISSTEWDNFFGLRVPPGDEPDRDFPAQWEFQRIGLLIREAMRSSYPEDIEYGAWHIPLIHKINIKNIHGTPDERIEQIKNVSARQLARVSYDMHTKTEDVAVAITKTGDLVKAAHFSPTEHIARPLEFIDTLGEYCDKIMMPASLLSVPCLNEHMDKMWCGNYRGWFQMRKEFPFEENHLLALEDQKRPF